MKQKYNDYTLPHYSVLMSVYSKDDPGHLDQSIRSMVNQTVSPDQFVLVEDGPLTKEQLDVIQSYNHEIPGLFTIVSLPENKGLGYALGIGLEACCNDIVARMDADDISLPDRCEAQLRAFADDPSLSIVGAHIDEFYDDPQKVICSRIVPLTHEDIFRASGRIMPFNHPVVMYRKGDVNRCGGYGTLRRKQDRDLFSRMMHGGCRAKNIDRPLLLFRSDESSYKRRKSWEYCFSTINVSFTIWKRGHCTLSDLLYVIVGQSALFLLPLPLMKKLSDKKLRRRYIT